MEMKGSSEPEARYCPSWENETALNAVLNFLSSLPDKNVAQKSNSGQEREGKERKGGRTRNDQTTLHKSTPLIPIK